MHVADEVDQGCGAHLHGHVASHPVSVAARCLAITSIAVRARKGPKFFPRSNRESPAITRHTGRCSRSEWARRNQPRAMPWAPRLRGPGSPRRARRGGIRRKITIFGSTGSNGGSPHGWHGNTADEDQPSLRIPSVGFDLATEPACEGLDLLTPSRTSGGVSCGRTGVS